MTIRVIDTIKPNGLPLGQTAFPSVEDIDTLGGYQVQPNNNFTSTPTIPVANQKVGMLVYSVSNTTFYQLTVIGSPGTWVVASFGGGGGGGGATDVNGLRLTLTTGTPVSIAGSSSTGSTLYLTPYVSEFIGLYDGASWSLLSTAEISLDISSITSGNNYDIFAQKSGSNVILVLGPAYANGATGGRTAMVRGSNGVLVSSGDATMRWVGTIGCVTNGQSSDDTTNRLVWNLENRVERAFAISTFNQTQTGGYTQAGGICTLVTGDVGDYWIEATSYALSASTTAYAIMGISVNGQTAEISSGESVLTKDFSTLIAIASQSVCTLNDNSIMGGNGIGTSPVQLFFQSDGTHSVTWVNAQFSGYIVS